MRTLSPMLGAVALFAVGAMPAAATTDMHSLHLGMRPSVDQLIKMSAAPRRVVERALKLKRRKRPAAFRKQVSGPTIYVSDYTTSVIWQLDTAGNVVGSLTDCLNPQGIRVDGSGDLWAACSGASSINEYAPSAVNATMVLNDPGEIPVDVTVNGDGTVYVSNIYNVSFGPGDVVYYRRPQNGASPTGALTDSNIYSSRFLDVDGRGNVYVDYLTSSNGVGIDEFAVSRHGHSHPATLPISLGFPGGVWAESQTGMLDVLDQFAYGIGQYDVRNGYAQTNLIGPFQNDFGFCNVVAFGPNVDDSAFALGDAGCRVAWTYAMGSGGINYYWNIDFNLPSVAAYSPSDK